MSVSGTDQMTRDDIETRILSFKNDLKELGTEGVVRKYLLHGDCVALTTNAYMDLRSKVAKEFNIHPNEVYVVGSAKLGFSIAPHKKFQHFNHNSDIDVAVISPNLFNELWEKTHYYFKTSGEWEEFNQFKKYLFKGWIRPDMFPPVPSFQSATSWWKFFNNLSASGVYSGLKVRGAIYRSFYFLESYQAEAVDECNSI